MKMNVVSLRLIFLRSQGVNILINTWDKADNSDTDDVVDESLMIILMDQEMDQKLLIYNLWQGLVILGENSCHSDECIIAGW